jgi:hypothetical protein
MSFGFKDTIKGYSNTYFENNKETGFTRRFKGYDPIKAFFDVLPRQIYLRRVVFGDLETEDTTFYPIPVFKNTSTFTMPPLHDFGLISNSNVLRSDQRHHLLIAKALVIHEHGGTKWYKQSNGEALSQEMYGNRYLFGRTNHPLNHNIIRHHASLTASNEIDNAKRLASIEKRTRNRHSNVLKSLKELPPLRSKSGKLVFPGGANSRQSLKRLEELSGTPLPANLIKEWNSLGLNPPSSSKATTKQSKKRTRNQRNK